MTFAGDRLRRNVMRRIAKMGLALLVAGCSAAPVATRGEQVPLLPTDREPGCVGVYEVMDIVADPNVGTVSRQGWPLKWPRGYTGWRFGAEVQVLDPDGEVVLTTGQRYELYLNASEENGFRFPTPMKDLEWAAGCIPIPCFPGRTCELGRHLM